MSHWIRINSGLCRILNINVRLWFVEKQGNYADVSCDSIRCARRMHGRLAGVTSGTVGISRKRCVCSSRLNATSACSERFEVSGRECFWGRIVVERSARGAAHGVRAYAVFCTRSRVIITEMSERRQNRNSPEQKRAKRKSKYAVIR